MARNVQVRITDLEVGDTIVGPGGGAFVYDRKALSLNNVPMVFDANNRVLVFPQTTAVVTITIP